MSSTSANGLLNGAFRRWSFAFAMGAILQPAVIPNLATLPAEAMHVSARCGLTQSDIEKSAKPVKVASSLLAITSTGEPLGQCPLRHTSVEAKISGYVARVTVKQIYQNTFKEKIEAVYTFPLSDSGAVDSMVMKIGDRTIIGDIKKREEARKMYDQAKSQGRVASLLDQERTNIFTQSVANIEPNKTVEITLQYVELLPFEDGKFTFVFPTVVGPRFIPGTPIGASGTGRLPNTDQVPDASRITPPVAEEGTHAGHDISIDVDIQAGMPIASVSSKLYEVRAVKVGPDHEHVSLLNETALPNKDFVLNWKVAQENLQSGYLVHKDPKAKSGYFSVMLVPPKRPKVEQVAPKEMIFLIDCSGSQRGLPLQKAKETMLYTLSHMNPQDTFQIISFNNGQTLLFIKPQPASAAMRDQATSFINSLEANGGTWMAPAVEEACAIPADNNRLRIVTFMTDGFVGNDYAIISMIRKLRGNSRWFSFGTGNSVNRALIDGMASEGGGEADYVLLNSSAEEVGKKFYDRISTPVLTDVKISFEGLAAKEVFPREVSDVWAQKPLFFKGRYEESGKGKIVITGLAAGKPYKKVIEASFPSGQNQNAVLGSVWARAKVDRLMSSDLAGAQSGTMTDELKNEIIATALEHHIMTQFTSFVAVDSASTTSGKAPISVTVPVELPEGVSRAGALGGAEFGGSLRGMALQKSVWYKSGYSGSHLKQAYSAAAAPAPRAAGVFSEKQVVTMNRPEPANGVREKGIERSKDACLDKKDALTTTETKLDKGLADLLKQYRTGLLKGDRKVKIEIEIESSRTVTMRQLKKLTLTSKSERSSDSLISTCLLAELEEILKLSGVKYLKLIALL